MAKFKAIPMIELAQVIPGWKEMALKNQLDTENLGKMFDAIDKYGEENGMQFFQVHHRKMDNSAIAIFKVKE
jgi:hypothetical protein